MIEPQDRYLQGLHDWGVSGYPVMQLDQAAATLAGCSNFGRLLQIY